MDNQNIQDILDKKSIELSKSFELVKADLMNQYRLILERGHTPPESITVTFDVHFDQL
jgi:hypothetical protein